MPIAVGGIAQQMPNSFPFTDENAGNMIHGKAPFEMFNGATDVRRSGWRKHYSASSAMDFINEQCSHYIFSFANFIQFNNVRDSKRQAYVSLQRSLEKVEVPLVVFGLGAQAPTDGDLSRYELPQEAIDFMKFLGEKCEAISVRGDFTARVFREYAGVENTYVTGCPSFFQRPAAFAELRENINAGPEGMVSFNATNYRKPAERTLMLRAIREKSYWLEVLYADVHRFHLESLSSPELAEVPASLRGFLEGRTPAVSRAELVDYFARYYRLFRETRPWYQFNREAVSFSYGTRFHGNMASLLAGKPARWITHDSRTKELTRTLHLPNISLSEAVETSTEELIARTDYTELFDNLRGMFENFNGYLDIVGLPRVELQF